MLGQGEFEIRHSTSFSIASPWVPQIQGQAYKTVYWNDNSTCHQKNYFWVSMDFQPYGQVASKEDLSKQFCTTQTSK